MTLTEKLADYIEHELQKDPSVARVHAQKMYELVLKHSKESVKEEV